MNPARIESLRDLWFYIDAHIEHFGHPPTAVELEPPVVDRMKRELSVAHLDVRDIEANVVRIVARRVL